MKTKVFAAGMVVIIAVVGVFLFVTNDEPDEKKEEQTAVDYENPPTQAKDLLEEQKERDESIKEESDGSTLDDPFIQVDPYDRSPLSALVIFDTDEDMQVSFVVKGKTADVNFSTTIEEYRDHHELPIVGLYPDAENEVTLFAEMTSGKTIEKTITIPTEPLPEQMPEVEILTADKDLMQDQTGTLNFAIPSTKYPYGYDQRGDIRWYGSMYNSHVFSELNNGHILYLSKDDNSGGAYNRLFETDYLGKLYNAFEISEEAAEPESEGADATLIHHDITELPTGNLLLTVNDGEGEYVEDTMIEIDRSSGEVVKEIDLKDLFPAATYEDYDATKEKEGDMKDWFHQNSVAYDAYDDSIIISGRNQDTIMKIDYDTEEIMWILSAPEDWDADMEKYLLKGVGDNFEYTGGQHDARILPDQDGDPDTIDLLVYDNNIHISHGENDASETYSGAIQYRINEQTKEAEVIWTYGEERGEEFFTSIIGSSRYLPETGNRIIGFGHVQQGKQSHLVEVTDDDETMVAFEAKISGFPKGSWVYRSIRRALYTDSWEQNY